MTQNQIEKLAADSYAKIVTPLLKHPDDLDVWALFVPSENIFAIDYMPHFADVGVLVGKDKNNLLAIANIVFLVGKRHGFTFKVNKPQPARIGVAEAKRNGGFSNNWNSTETVRQLQQVIELFASQPFTIEVLENHKEFKTKFRIITSEKFELALGEVAYSLSKIFHAIGHTKGRLIYVEATEKKPIEKTLTR